MKFIKVDGKFGISDSQPTLIMFTTDWCPLCKELFPGFISIANKVKIKCLHVDTDKNPECRFKAAGTAFQLDDVPRFILFNKGLAVAEYRIPSYVSPASPQLSRFVNDLMDFLKHPSATQHEPHSDSCYVSMEAAYTASGSQ